MNCAHAGEIPPANVKHYVLAAFGANQPPLLWLTPGLAAPNIGSAHPQFREHGVGIGCGDQRRALHVAHRPNTSTTWLGWLKPFSAATAFAQLSTASALTSTVVPQLRQIR
jgi:hypothetical protein